MYWNKRQSKTFGMFLKWAIFSTVFTLGFIGFLNTRDSLWLKVNIVFGTSKTVFLFKPLSVKISFANLTAEATFQTEVVVEAREKTNLGSDDIRPTPKVTSVNFENYFFRF